MRAVLESLLDEARKDPAVDAVSVASGMPFGFPNMMNLTLSTPERISVNQDDYDRVSAMAGTPAIFSTIGVPIVRGRGFDERDQSGAAPVVVVSAFTARRLFGAGDPVGRQVVIQTPSRGARTATVIGLARHTDLRTPLGEPRRSCIYRSRSSRSASGHRVRAADGTTAVAACAALLAPRRYDLAVDTIGTGRMVQAGVRLPQRPSGSARSPWAR